WLHGEDAAREWGARKLLLAHALARSRDVEDVHITAAEDAARRLANRHLDLMRDAAIRVIAHYAAGAVVHAPDAALRVDRQAVREGPAALVDGREHSSGREGPGIGVEVVGEDRIAEAFAEVERAVIRAPSEPIGTDDIGLSFAQHQFCIEAIERT